jgi:ubiquinone/menaquinone biosynthesis C-methylase UbiE
MKNQSGGFKMDLKEWQNIAGYVERGIGIDVGCGDFKIDKKNIIAIDIENPKADIIADWEKGVSDNKVDFVLMTYSLCFAVNPVNWIKKAVEVLKPGGRLIITEGYQKIGRHIWHHNEMEGFLKLFDKWLTIDIKQNTGNDKSYQFILIRKGV